MTADFVPWWPTEWDIDALEVMAERLYLFNLLKENET